MKNRIFTSPDWPQALLLKARGNLLKGLIAMTLLLPAFSVLQGQDCISGIVFEDANANGFFDAADLLLQGVEVELEYPDGSNSIMSTSVNGVFEFCSLMPGNYKISPIVETQLYFVNFAIPNVNLIQGQSITNITFPLVPLSYFGNINGIVFFDLDGDGQKKIDEPGLSMAPIRETFNAQTTNFNTDANGFFTQNFLPPGAYSHTITSFPSWAILLSPDVVISDVGSSSEQEVVFRLGVNPSLGGILDLVCLDIDNNGIINQADAGVAQMLVTLKNVNGQTISTTLTDKNGLYSFLGLSSGTYTVEVNSLSLDADPITPVTYQLNVSAGQISRASPFYFAQVRSLFNCGMAVMTCFSGYDFMTSSIKDDYVFGVFDTRNPPALNGSAWGSPTVPLVKPVSWKSGNLGQVFGIALDHNNSIYLTASTSYNFFNPSQATAIGFGGPGAVYKVDISLTPTLFTSLPNSGNTGLGNICFDQDNNQFFVSNFEDGKIYRISNTGTILSTYDPYFGEPAAVGMDNGTSGYTPLGQRVWAVGIYDNQLYFSRWTHNAGANSPPIPQQIWRVSLDGTGEFTGSLNTNLDFTGAETLIIDVIALGTGKWSAPVSDIAFSEDGTLVLAERGMSAVSSIYNHRSRIIKYPRISGGYNAVNYQFIYIGNFDVYDNNNSAGGIAINPGGYDAVTGQFGTCDSLLLGTGDALRWGLAKNCTGTGGSAAYGFAIMPFSGNSNSIGNGLPLPPVNCSSLYVHVGAQKGDLGDIETFFCPDCIQIVADCDNLGLATLPTPIDTSDNDCCWSLDYINTGSTTVHAIEIKTLDGVTFHGRTYPTGYAHSFTDTSETIFLPGFAPLSPAIDDVLSFCLGNRNAVPQFVVVSYLDSTAQVICTDTLRFECPPEEPCLYILSDSLVCDSLGYKYTAEVKNPISSDFAVGFVKFNIHPMLPTGVTTNPDPPRFILPTPLQPGESTTIMFTIETGGLDLYGDSLCFVLSAHDDERERLCCAAIDTCIAFPICDPCILVDAEAVPIFPNQRDSCCYDLLITNQYPTPNYFTNIQTTIVSPGVQFSSVTYPVLSGWIGVEPAGSPPKTNYLWSHTSGAVPNVSAYNLFDFCIKGSTTTDSVYIAVNWLVGDSIVCTDTIGVFCPECLEIGETDLNCLPDSSYVYTIFNMVNNSPFSVNAVGLVETSPIDTILNAGVYPVPLTPPNGTISVPIYVWIADGLTEACFDIVLRFVDDSTGVNFTCCYATHCIELPPCDSLSTTPCPDPSQISQDPCPQVFDPVCGCDGQEYPNACVAENNGVLVYENKSCTDGVGTPPIVQISLSASERVGGGADLTWRPIWSELMHSYFVQRRRPGGVYQTIAVVSAANVMAEETFMDVNPGKGFNEYRVLGITEHGYTRYSNEDDLFVQWDQSGQINVTVFPVPARNEIFVASSKQGECTLEVVSTDGRIFSSIPVSFDGMPVSVNVENLAEGVFFVRLNYNDGETTQQRFVKVR